MNIREAKLIDKEGRVVATYIQTDKYEMSTSGEVRNTISWCEGEIYNSEFFAHVNVKWDGCSHIRFYGEDYVDEESGDKDSYYHICGITSYIQFMRLLVFSYEIMIKHVGWENVLEKEEYGELSKLNLLDGYKIEYFE